MRIIIVFLLAALVGICRGNNGMEQALQTFREGMVQYWERPDFEQLSRFPPTLLVEDEEMAIVSNFLSFQMMKFYTQLRPHIDSTLSKTDIIQSLEAPVIKRLLLLSLNSMADIDFENPNSVHPLSCSLETSQNIARVTKSRPLFLMGRSAKDQPSHNFYCDNEIPLLCSHISKELAPQQNFNIQQLERVIKSMNNGKTVLPHLEFSTPLSTSSSFPL